jgi:hypothetical protein
MLDGRKAIVDLEVNRLDHRPSIIGHFGANQHSIAQSPGFVDA